MIGTKWIKNDIGHKAITVTHMDRYGVDFVYDDDKQAKVYWQLRSHFEANFTPVPG